MKDSKIVWSDEEGDLRKKKVTTSTQEVLEASLELTLRRLTSGKGRTIVELGSLPQNKKWCQKLAKDLKKKLGAGGSYKNNIIEIHGEKSDAILAHLNQLNIKVKKIGG